MLTCNNCQGEFDESKEGVVARSRGTVASAICDRCMTGARKIKLVLARGEIGGFTYEQYTAIEIARKAG